MLEDRIYYHVCRLDVDPATYGWDHLQQKGISDPLTALWAYHMYHPVGEAVCIDGFIYFGVWTSRRFQTSAIGRFDVINERLDFVLTPIDIDDTGYNIARNFMDYNGS
ncbi:unnamed protein product [Arabis nemorensis]|uniref:F-box associated beta-propeller type 3 domain-containing protein n=1 Tax=Arabis nemorensis TaxID=586526 RepID=A0A565AXH6_9BRAS|nr:unnamed protein product [Arabis nemorensis]